MKENKLIDMPTQSNISSFKIIIIFLILGFSGMFIIPKLSLHLNPSQSLPSIVVNFNWPNISPYVIEKNATSVLEGAFATMRGVQKMSSNSYKGKGNINLVFDKHTNIDYARFEVASIIRQLYKTLPEKISYPVININKPNEDQNKQAFLSYRINAPQTPFTIQKTVKNRLEPVIAGIQGVDKTIIYGANPKEYIITYNFHILNQFHITKQEVIIALQQQFSRESLGQILLKKDYITLAIKSNKLLNWHIPIKKVKQRLIYLDDIATIKELEQEASTYYRVNGRNAITLSIYATKNANTIVLSKKIAQILNETKKQLPKNYSITETYNSTEYLEKELNKIYERTGYTICILILFIFLISGSYRYLLITFISLVSNLGIAFLLYYFLGIEIHLYSLAGITISLGLILDNSIVMIDHIKKQRNNTAFLPILAATSTTIGTLSVVYFLEDRYKINLVDFSLVISVNMGVSLLVSLFLVPALIEKIPFKKTPVKRRFTTFQNLFFNTYYKLIIILLRFKKTLIIIIIIIFGIPFFMLPQKLESNSTLIEKTYNTYLGNEWYRENIRPHIDRYLGGSFRLFTNYVYENSYYNINEETKLYIMASMEKGATVHQMNEAFIEVENYLQYFSKINKYTSIVYSGNHARMEISFKDEFQNSSFPYTLKAQLVKKVLDIGGIDWNIYGVGNGFNSREGGKKPISFTVEGKGYNYDNLNDWADTLKTSLKKHPRIQKIRIKGNSYWSKKPSYEYSFRVDKEQLAILKSNPSKLFKQLKSLTLSKQPDLHVNIDAKYTPLRLVSDNSKQFDLWNLKNTPLKSDNTSLILKNIASIYKEREEEKIYKENQEYIRTVQFEYIGSSKIGTKFLNKKLNELRVKLPLGYRFETIQRNPFLNDNNNTSLLFLVIGIIYIICAILFESLKQPFIILTIVPISFIGVFLTFYLFDFNFDQGGLASFVLLSGITVNASIFIIDGFNRLKKQHTDADFLNLYIKAFKQKIFPITLTIISTIIAFIPFVKDGQKEVFWFALGAGTIGGLLFSIVGILIYLPLFTLKRKS